MEPAAIKKINRNVQAIENGVVTLTDQWSVQFLLDQ
jgi:hypothetical protein